MSLHAVHGVIFRLQVFRGNSTSHMVFLHYGHKDLGVLKLRNVYSQGFLRTYVDRSRNLKAFLGHTPLAEPVESYHHLTAYSLLSLQIDVLG